MIGHQPNERRRLRASGLVEAARRRRRVGHARYGTGEFRAAPTVRAMQRLATEARLDFRRVNRVIDVAEAAIAAWPMVARALDIHPAVVRRLESALTETRAVARARRVRA